MFQMETDDPRAVLDALIRDRGDDYASISRMLGRNSAYIQQFIKRGSPKRLDEEDRRILARYFGVDEERLGARPAKPAGPRMIEVPQLAVGASAGPGAIVGEERAKAKVAFEAEWLRSIASGVSALSIIQVTGDSMFPALSDGDDILVDRGDAAARLRDGVYVLRMDDALLVKRIALNPVSRTIAVMSDNPAYPSWPECDPAAVEIIGRVVWAGRRIG